MGSRGYYCIRHKGKYYIYYIWCNAYASCSGVRLLALLWTENLDVWRNLLDKMIIVEVDDPPQITPDIIRKIHSIRPANTEGYDTGESLLERWRNLLAQDLHDDDITISDVLSYGYIFYDDETCQEVEPELSLFIEWVYIVDLDTDSFRVKSKVADGYILRVEFRVAKLPLYLCDKHILPGRICCHCQQSSHAVGKVIYTNMFDMVVAMRIILWRHNGDSIFSHEIWLGILQFFGECCGLDYSDAVAIVKMVETSRYNHKQCLRCAILFHSEWLRKICFDEDRPQIRWYADDRSEILSSMEEGSEILSSMEEGSEILSDAEDGSEILSNSEDRSEILWYSEDSD
ncbi:hypothetical protein BC938DRAFT_473079 [Jimgerdemannia flammicorona]|uniref:Uncharacterized protein n=1 Tax=Jimgerdemannia flammicorona TaxID=994334 RepID=A0A433Q4N6_9FUNG|nr:hypothetical protein BC938DRAFT_473079 [Jimgerdemannia flammicorona]